MFVFISLLLAAVCLLPAADKLLGHPRMRAAAAHFGISWPRYRLIGEAELAAAAGILIGLWWHPLGLPAAAGMALLLLVSRAAWSPGPGWPSASGSDLGPLSGSGTCAGPGWGMRSGGQGLPAAMAAWYWRAMARSMAWRSAANSLHHPAVV